MKYKIVLIIVFFIFISRCLYGYDVGILYDLSGSIKWSKQWQEAMKFANQDIISLIGDGHIVNKDVWNLKKSPLFEEKIHGSLLQEGSYLLYLEFGEIEFSNPPFFRNYDGKFVNVDELNNLSGLLKSWLPSSDTVPKSKLTFLQAAKWQAMNLLDKARATDERILIIFSDFNRDVGGKYSKEESVLDKVSEYRTGYTEKTLLKAYWKANRKVLQLISFEVVLVKPSQTEIPPSTPPSPEPKKQNKIESIKILPKRTKIAVGESFQFTVKAKKTGSEIFKDFPASDLVWLVSDKRIADISQSGMFKAKKTGKVNVQVSLKSSSQINDQASVRITKSSIGKFLLISVIIILFIVGIIAAVQWFSRRRSSES